jgi:hypothetical protein
MMKKSIKNVSSYYCEKCDYTCSTTQHFNKHVNTRKHENAITIEESASEKVSENVFDYYCKPCNYTCSYKCNYEKHLATRKHKNTRIDAQKVSENVSEYYCKLCDCVYSNKCNYTRHITSYKHKAALLPNDAESFLNPCKHCKRTFAYASGLAKHAKTCIDPVILNADLQTTRIVEFFMKDKKETYATQAEKNKEDQKSRDELMKHLRDERAFRDELLKNLGDEREFRKDLQRQVAQLAVAANTVMAQPKTVHFNINTYLNVTCKNAVNISEFVDSIKMDLDDFNHFRVVGYKNGLMAIVRKNLDMYPANERPIQCASLRPRIIYVKADDVWAKDELVRDANDQMVCPKLNAMLNKISKANERQLCKWQRANPEYATFAHMEYQHTLNTTHCLTANSLDCFHKINTKIAQYTSIPKSKKQPANTEFDV